MLLTPREHSCGQAEEQWIFQGMTNEEVNDAFNRRIKEGGGINSSMKTPDIIGALKEQRRAQSKL